MNTNDNQEIDLLELLAKLYKAVLKNWITAIILPLAGAIAAISINSSSENSIQSSMLIATDLLTKEEFEFLFQELDKTDSFPGLTFEQMTRINNLNFSVVDEKISANQSTYKSIYAKV